MKPIWKKRILRVISNWGISFLTPLLAVAPADYIFNTNINFGEMSLVSLVSSSIQTGIVVFQEVKNYASR